MLTTPLPPDQLCGETLGAHLVPVSGAYLARGKARKARVTGRPPTLTALTAQESPLPWCGELDEAVTRPTVHAPNSHSKRTEMQRSSSTQIPKFPKTNVSTDR